MKTNISVALKSLTAVLVLGLAAAVGRAEFASSTGFDYTSGKYGLDSKTTIGSWNVITEYSAQDWTSKIIVPFERISTPGGVTIVNGRPQIIGSTLAEVLKAQHMTLAQYRLLTRQQRIDFLNANAPRQTISGLGDIEFSTRYDAYHDKETGWDTGISGSITFGTADSSKGLGSGRATYDLCVDLSRTIGRFTPTVSFGCRAICKPSDSDQRDYAYGSIGSSFWITDNTNLSLTFDTAQRSSDSSNVDNELS